MITQEEFTKTMERIKLQDNFINTLENLSQKCGGGYIELPNLIDICVDLLQKLTNDTDKWISYYIWELDWGTEYRAGYISEGQRNIRLASVSDLYALLTNHPVYEKSDINE